MIDPKFKDEILYQAALCKFKKLLKEELITQAQYQQADQLLLDRFHPFISSLDDGSKHSQN